MLIQSSNSNEHSLLLLLARLSKEREGFLDLGVEVIIVSDQLFQVDDLFVKKHTGQSWSISLAEGLGDSSEDGVTHKLVALTAFKAFKLSHVNLRKLHLCNLVSLSWISRLLLLIWLLLIQLTVILVVSTSTLGTLVVCTTAAISTSLVISVTSVISTVILVSVHVLLHHIGTLRHFILEKIDEFLDGVDVLFFALMVKVVSGLPELNVESSATEAKLMSLVKSLDSLLGLLDVLEADEASLGADDLATGTIVDHEVLHFD